MIDALGFAFDHREETFLADGSVFECAVYRATIIWDGNERPVFVQASDGDALVGTLLMDGYELRVEMRTGGAVMLQLLP